MSRRYPGDDGDILTSLDYNDEEDGTVEECGWCSQLATFFAGSRPACHAHEVTSLHEKADGDPRQCPCTRCFEVLCDMGYYDDDEQEP